MGMNNWSFTGHLGRDAETRHTANGDAVVQFSVAVTSGYGDKQQTTWPRCALWGKRGEAVAQYLVKGQLVSVTGEVTLREYDDKDGNRRSSLEVRVDKLSLEGGKREDPAPVRPEPVEGASVGWPSGQQAKQKPAPVVGDLDDEIPF